MAIQRKDASKYLKGLTTNPITRIDSSGGGLFAAFLTPKGRVIVLDDQLIASGNEVETTPPSNEAAKERLGKMNATIGIYDNRAVKHMGYRVIAPKG
ncbi:hypothetical protein EC957_002023 [Mortierella hygrophila]|uniref:Uncharacterized protein n=1 Tax=Mortierella hygrophila TaxID=979708 RepID=A0A9P6FFY8_9FUNG|nr:hypothetical protein EC957_002023 [Mortierella hygrophila]